MKHRTPLIRIGLPRSIMNDLAHQAMALNAPILVSMGSFFDVRRWGFTRIGMAPWFMSSAVDSAGFTAMLQGGYRWTVWDHVEFLATNGSRQWYESREARGLPDLKWWESDDDDPNPATLPFPWDWWAAMDYCCEEQIAGSRTEVEHRMKLTVETYEQTLNVVKGYWDEGWDVYMLPRPMPTLQGRLPADYIWSAQKLAEVWARRPMTDTEEMEQLETCDGRGDEILPRLIGVGSVCGRGVDGPEGVLRVLEALHKELPHYVKLHLFGVKGEVLRHLSSFQDRVASIDSMAWDAAARRAAGKERKKHGVFDPKDPEFFSCTMDFRKKHMREWYESQLQKQTSDGPARCSLLWYACAYASITHGKKFTS